MARRIIFLENIIENERQLRSEYRTLTKPAQLHWHGYIELELITSGSGVQVLNGHEATLERGYVTVLRHTDFHRLTPTPRMELFNLAFDEKYLSEPMLSSLWSCPDSLCRRFDEESFAAIIGLAELIRAENVGSGNTQYMAKLIECILIKVLGLGGESLSKKPISKMRWAVDYMESHFMYDPSLSEIASLLHYSEKYFSALFHREFGMTYSDYLTRLKVEYAKKLLIGTNLGMEIIGSECGFNSPSNFRRAFNEICGCSPRSFRDLCHTRGS